MSRYRSMIAARPYEPPGNALNRLGFNAADLTWNNLDSGAPHPSREEPIFISIDFEKGCRQPGLSEIGIASLDMRRVRAVPPKDRGKGWARHIRVNHFRVRQNPHSPLPLRAHERWCQQKPQLHSADLFGFGRSRMVSQEHLSSAFFVWLRSYETHNTTHLERVSGYKRKIILLVWDSNLEYREFRNMAHHLGPQHDWFQHCEVWDVQALPIFRLNLAVTLSRQNPQPISLEKAIRYLGVYDAAGVDAMHGFPGRHILHNAANDAVYTIEAMLAGLLLHADLKEQMLDGRPLPHLGRTWRRDVIDRNIYEERVFRETGQWVGATGFQAMT